MSLHHTHDGICPLCEAKLLDAEPVIASWFRGVKKRYPNVHVSWAYRGQEDQDRFFRNGKSSVRYPHSQHNAVKDGKPCSRALDLFQIDEDGVARFSDLFYSKLASEIGAHGDPIRWGGDWNGNHQKDKGDRDFDHFELLKPQGAT